MLDARLGSGNLQFSPDCPNNLPGEVWKEGMTLILGTHRSSSWACTPSDGISGTRGCGTWGSQGSGAGGTSWARARASWAHACIPPAGALERGKGELKGLRNKSLIHVVLVTGLCLLLCLDFAASFLTQKKRQKSWSMLALHTS